MSFDKSKPHCVQAFCFVLFIIFTRLIDIIFFEQDLILLRELLYNTNKTTEFHIFHSHTHLQMLLVMYV